MSRDPSRRPASAAEVAEVLESVRPQPAVERSMPVAIATGGPTTTAVADTSSTSVGDAERSTSAGVTTQRWWAWAAAGLALVGALVWWRADAPIGLHESTAGGDGSTSPATEAVDGGEATIHAVAVAGSAAHVAPETTDSGRGPTDGSTGSSTAQEREADAEASASDDTSAAESASSPSTPRSGCRRARGEAQAALDRRDWWGVIRASSDRSCWSAGAQRIGRKAMRVKAWLELGRYERCVDEGKGETEPSVARLIKYCREKIAKNGG
jgi:hypothetical protein